MSRICSLLAGFQVTIIGRFWVTAEGVADLIDRALLLTRLVLEVLKLVHSL
jgi:hypothetical protein